MLPRVSLCPKIRTTSQPETSATHSRRINDLCQHAERKVIPAGRGDCNGDAKRAKEQTLFGDGGIQLLKEILDFVMCQDMVSHDQE